MIWSWPQYGVRALAGISRAWYGALILSILEWDLVTKVGTKVTRGKLEQGGLDELNKVTATTERVEPGK